MKVNFIIPTYNRVNSLSRLVNSLSCYADNPDWIYYTLVLHEGDNETESFAKLLKNTTIVKENLEVPHLAKFMNMGYGAAVKSDIYVYIGDDFECKTDHWDKIVVDAMDDSNGWALVCGPDGYLGNPGCPTYFFVSHRVIDAVGEFVCPYYQREGTDKIWGDIMWPLGLVAWNPKLRFEHWHATRQGGNNDATFQRLCTPAPPVYGKDSNNYTIDKQKAIRGAMAEQK
jgi:hypothetical protein